MGEWTRLAGLTQAQAAVAMLMLVPAHDIKNVYRERSPAYYN